MTNQGSRRHETSLDESTATAWRTFAERLTDVINNLVDVPMLLLVEEGDAVVARMQVRIEDDALLAVVRGNADLPPGRRLSRSALAQVRRMGWVPDGSRQFYRRSFDREAPTEAAATLVVLFRDVIGVLHPAFLAFREATLMPAPLPRRPAPTRAARAGLRTCIEPTSSDHLDLLVEKALSAVIGRTVYRSECGEIEIEVGDGEGAVWVEWSTDRLTVPLVATLATGVPLTVEALATVNALNSSHRGITFSLDRGVLHARVEVLARPFRGEHLIHHLAQLCDLVINEREQIRTRLGEVGRD